VVTIVLQLLFVLAGFGAAGMAYGLSIGTILMFPVTHYYLRTLPKVPSMQTIRSIWSFARYSTPSAFVSKVYDRYDMLLLGFLATPAVAGHYEVAYKLTVPTMFVAGLSSAGLLAKVSDYYSRGGDPAQDIVNTVAFSSILAIPIFFGALAIPEKTVVTTFGAEYRAAGALLIWLALYRVISTQSGVLGSIVNGMDMPAYELRASTLALALNIPLGILLYFVLGPVGVVVATVVAEILRYLLLYRVVRSETVANLVPRSLLIQIGAGAIMFLVVSVSDNVISVRSWIDLGVLLAIGGGVYFLLLLTFSRHFRVTIRSVIAQARADIAT
jgi:O-antigen/teichoic acid export membrane protein